MVHLSVNAVAPPQLCYQGWGSARYRVTFILIYGNFLPSRAITVSEHCRTEDTRHAAGIAEQKSLEHRVEYATVDLNLSEEYKSAAWDAGAVDFHTFPQRIREGDPQRPGNGR